MTDTNIAASLAEALRKYLNGGYLSLKFRNEAAELLAAYDAAQGRASDAGAGSAGASASLQHPNPSGRTQAQGEPVAWVLVPREPTPAMIEEAYKRNPMVGPPESLTEERARQHRERHERNLRANWKAMIAAAPSPAVAEQQAPSEARAVTDELVWKILSACRCNRDDAAQFKVRAALESFAHAGNQDGMDPRDRTCGWHRKSDGRFGCVKCDVSNDDNVPVCEHPKTYAAIASQPTAQGVESANSRPTEGLEP